MSSVIPQFDASNVPSMDGKVVVITGANSGIGYVNAIELVQIGAQVISACRSETKGTEAQEKIIQQARASEYNGNGKAIFLPLDLSDLTSIKSFANKLHEQVDHVNVLINNAGMTSSDYALSSQAIELQFATNHLGHFALTSHLMELLKKEVPSRIVNVSSVAHRRAVFDLNNLPPSKDTYDVLLVYRVTKLCNLFFTYELERRLRQNQVEGVICVAAHPGLALTQFFENWFQGSHWFTQALVKSLTALPVFQSAEMGALSILYAATVPQVKGGEYYGPDGPLSMWGNPTLEQSSEQSH